jgi:phytoene dehydrogenase-like protein
MSSSITIIGGGISGLAAGIYARMNGYSARIYEMHSLPGGLCTSWRRKGFLVDGCIHWLCGSGPGPSLHDIWQELGAGGLQYVNHRSYLRMELPNLVFEVYADASELENEMLRISPDDGKTISAFCEAIRQYADWGGDIPDSLEGKEYSQHWSTVTIGQLADGLHSRDLAKVLTTLFWREAPVMFILLPLGFSHARSAGYPIGGSLVFSQAIEKRFLDLGGEIHYNSCVEKILVENGRAIGLRLAGGEKVCKREGDIISTIDAHTTFYDLLDGQFLNDGIRAWFDQIPVIGSPLQVTLGIDLPLLDAPTATNGILFVPASPINLYGEDQEFVNIDVFSFDPTAAPPGKSVVKVDLYGSYDFWKDLHRDPDAYAAEKERIAKEVIAALDLRFPGLAAKVEMVDVATPLTFERYTGNWQGSSQGWIPTPQAFALQERSLQEGNWPASRSVPGLEHFYMAGQWLEPFGGLPVAALTARSLIATLCRRDGKPFFTTWK